MSENTKTEIKGTSRRKLLQTVGTVGITSTFGIGAAAGRESSSENDIVEGRDLFDDLLAIYRSGECKDLHAGLSERGLSPKFSDAVGMPVPVDDIPSEADIDINKLRNTSPISVFVPFETTDSTSQAFLNVMVVDYESERVPVSGWGIVGEKQEGATAIEVLGFEEDSEQGSAAGTGGAQSDSAERTVGTIDQFEVNDEEGVGSAQGIDKAACLAIVGGLCKRYGDSASYRACASICLRTANPFAAAGCGAFCVGLVRVIKNFGCTTSGGAVCELVL